MTLPTPDAQVSQLLPQRLQLNVPLHSMPVESSLTFTPFSLTPPPRESRALVAEPVSEAVTFSLDHTQGRFKPLPVRSADSRHFVRPAGDFPRGWIGSVLADWGAFASLVVLACLFLMLLGGGVMLFVMLQF
ncbi:hypothetical protein [Ktedonospora formicarum]|uniref:hypothetical protein n=1 Tax=Ktedonospora formicarum TaxID=2778364 RepID=UPI001C687F4F|nr:hypothetical protein [Ktedonospora formicarum]